jgi:hypothetical protein
MVSQLQIHSLSYGYSEPRIFWLPVRDNARLENKRTTFAAPSCGLFVTLVEKKEIKIYKHIYIQNDTWTVLIHIVYPDFTTIARVSKTTLFLDYTLINLQRPILFKIMLLGICGLCTSTTGMRTWTYSRCRHGRGCGRGHGHGYSHTLWTSLELCIFSPKPTCTTSLPNMKYEFSK